jgi:putative membrane protein
VGSDRAVLQRVFSADGWWGAAAALWIPTGLWRWMAGLEKSPSYYSGNHVFMAKMGLLLLILALEIWPMVTLIRWRRRAGADRAWTGADIVPRAKVLARISDLQLLLVIAIVVAAVSMARGYGAG